MSVIQDGFDHDWVAANPSTHAYHARYHEPDVLFLIRWGLPRQAPLFGSSLMNLHYCAVTFVIPLAFTLFPQGWLACNQVQCPQQRWTLGTIMEYSNMCCPVYLNVMFMHGCFSYFSKIRQSPIAHIHCCHAKLEAIANKARCASNRILFPSIYFPCATFDLTIHHITIAKA